MFSVATSRIERVVSAAQQNESWSYTYDELDRLLSASNVGDASLTRTFSYDSAHNITNNSSVGAYSYPPAGSARPHAATQAGPYTYTYDANGNVLTKSGGAATITHTRNQENKLAEVQVGGIATIYRYDANNARVWKETTTGSQKELTVYLGGDAEIDPAGVWTKYVHDDIKRVGTCSAGDCSGVQPLVLHRDHLKSVRVITDASGSSVKRTVYAPYGSRAQIAGTHRESKGFIGERHDTETDYLFLQAR